jgi:hypothetical protein
LLPLVEFTLLDGVNIGLARLHVADGVPNGTVYAYSGEATRAGKDDVTPGVIPCVVLVLLKDGELN